MISEKREYFYWKLFIETKQSSENKELLNQSLKLLKKMNIKHKIGYENENLIVVYPSSEEKTIDFIKEINPLLNENKEILNNVENNKKIKLTNGLSIRWENAISPTRIEEYHHKVSELIKNNNLNDIINLFDIIGESEFNFNEISDLQSRLHIQQEINSIKLINMIKKEKPYTTYVYHQQYDKKEKLIGIIKKLKKQEYKNFIKDIISIKKIIEDVKKITEEYKIKEIIIEGNPDYEVYEALKEMKKLTIHYKNTSLEETKKAINDKMSKTDMEILYPYLYIRESETNNTQLQNKILKEHESFHKKLKENNLIN